MLPTLASLVFLTGFLVGSVSALEEIEVTSASACELCDCVPGSDNPRYVASCSGSQSISIVSLPSFVSGLTVSNASAVVFQRGAIRAPRNALGDDTFSIVVSNVRSVSFQPKSLGLDRRGVLNVELHDLQDVRFPEGSLSARFGTFTLSVVGADEVQLDGRAFDVLAEVRFARVDALRLAPLALKPTQPLDSDRPHFQASFENSTIPALPSDLFPSSSRIAFQNCNISDVETNAFSGFRIVHVTFDRTSVGRFHRESFPGKSLIERLEIDRCSISSISPGAIASAISAFSLRQTVVSSISSGAVRCPAVAKVEVSNSTFKTLGNRSFVFRSWSRLDIVGNDFNFVESDAFMGISFEAGNASFAFWGNRIRYANRHGMLLQNGSEAASFVVRDNAFHERCHCRFRDWLDVLTGGAGPFAAAVQNSSLCRAEGYDCFEGPFVRVDAFHEAACNGGAGCRAATVWDDFQARIEADTSKGMLLIILLFALASSLVVAILTLFRWIVFAIWTKDRLNPEDGWNFVAKEEEEEEEERPVTLSESSPSTAANNPEEHHYECLPLDTDPGRSSSKEPDPTPESKTFYDEMLCLLKDKLDDPDNYATVVDTRGETSRLLYQDPHES